MSLFPIGSLVQADTVSGETTGTNANYYNRSSSQNAIFSHYDAEINNNTSDLYQCIAPNLNSILIDKNNNPYYSYFNQLLNDNNANAIVIKMYDAKSDSYTSKIIDTVSREGTVIGVVAEYLENYVYPTASIQQELYGYMKTNDIDGIKRWMSKYLPNLYLANLSDAEIASFNQLSTKDVMAYFGDNSSSIDISAGTLLDTLFSFNFYDTYISGSERSYTYKNANLSDGSVWRPMDRTLTTKNGLSGTFSMLQYWANGPNGVTTSDESLIPDFQGADNTISVTYDNPNSVTPINSSYITAITVDHLNTGKNSVIDLSYANTSTGSTGGKYTGTYTDSNGNEKSVTVSSSRVLIADTATLAEGTTFRLGAYGTSDYHGNASTDTVYIGTASPADSSASKTNLYIQLGYVPGILSGDSYGAGYVSSPKVYVSGPNVSGQLLGIYSGADKFTVTAQASKADGIYSVYEITPVIGEQDNYFTDPSGNLTGTMWYLKGYTYEDTGEIAESGRTAGDNALTLQNLWKTHVSSLFNRPEDLHRRYTVSDGKTPRLGRDLDEKENVWAEAWHGRYSSTSDYGRHVGQNYTGLQAGYDKLLNGTYGGGKVYAGLFAAHLDSDSDTSTGKGDQDGLGLGFYGTWVGSKGHYVDAVVSALRLSDDYYFIGNTGDGTLGNVYGKWSTWTYGMGMQYGKRNDRDNGFWWDPHVSVYMGHMDHQNYTLSNGLGVENKDYDILTGRIGVTAGKTFEKNKGRVYAGVSLAHEFGDGQDVDQYWNAVDTSTGTTQNISDVSKRERAAKTGGHDTWMELKAGGDVRLSDSSKFHAEYARSVGRKDGNDWSVSGRLEFAWAGLGGHNERVRKEQHGVMEKESMPSYEKAHAPTVVLGQAPEETVPVSAAGQKTSAISKKAESVQSRQQTVRGENAGAVPVTAGMAPDVPSPVNSYDSAVPANEGNNSAAYEGTPEGYQLKGVTVEADRPDWEKELSPGQVSVIYPKDFEGEQKDLPALLDRIPGLFIDHMNGQGHYTTARIRGSTAGQVDVYVDGVRMNMNGEAAVNLSAIPVDNVERIEVYRGYVPARFIGAPLGGVINIITKKPAAGHGYVTQGFRSYGGYTSTYEYSMPLGTGSLMATWGRDIWQGDFRFYRPHRASEIPLPTSYHRRSNDYQNNDGMIKWQDDHWMIKAQYRDNQEGLAHALSGASYFIYQGYYGKGYLDQRMETKYKEFYVGRQDTWKNLNVNWHIAYTDEDKHYYNTGAMKAINTPASEWPRGMGSQPTAGDYLPGQLWSHYHSKKWDYNLNLAYHLWNSHLIEFNGDIVRERMDTDGSAWDATQEAINSQTGVYYTWRKMIPTYHNKEYHFTLQDTMTLNDAGDLKLTAIGRADKVDMEGLWEDIGGKDKRWRYSGGAALQKQLDSHWSAKTSWGTYYRHPNFYELFGDGGTIMQSYFLRMVNRLGFKNGTWESGTQFDFSLNRQGKILGADSDTVVTWFQRKSDNQLVLYTPWRGPGVSYYMPSGRMNIHGIELSQHMKWNRLNLALAATWQKGDSKQSVSGYSVSSLSAGNNSFVPEWVINARLDYTFPGDRFSLFGEYRFNGTEVIQGSQSSGEVSKTILSKRDSYSIVDLGAKYKFDNGIKLSMGVNDVFNQGYKVLITTAYYYGPRVSNLYPLAGRVYYATIGYSF
jgi:outer membrane autotransporter protein